MSVLISMVVVLFIGVSTVRDRIAAFGQVHPKDLHAPMVNQVESVAIVERVEMCRGTVVVDGKVYSVRRQAEPVYLLRLNELSAKYVVVTADCIDFHGFERFVWPLAAEQICVFERLEDAAAYYLMLTGTSDT
jgi:hypothetical protein